MAFIKECFMFSGVFFFFLELVESLDSIIHEFWIVFFYLLLNNKSLFLFRSFAQSNFVFSWDLY